jgi:hypothetical protein
MKTLLLFLLVISFTALPAQNYQYFTAKQGIPKAMEIAKQYFHSDSVELYSIKAVRWTIIFYIPDSIHWLEQMVLIDSINPYNDTTGKSLYWYYLICNSNDSCYYFRLWNYGVNYEIDSVFKNTKPDYYELPLHEKDIIIDTDSLVKCLDANYVGCLNYSDLYFSKDGYPFGHNWNVPVWYYDWKDLSSTAEAMIYINTETCESFLLTYDVSEKNNSNNSSFIIKSDPNTDNITIETNLELSQVAELRLYDQVGVLHFADKFRNKSYELNTYNFPSGLYLLQIKYGGNVITKTVMIVH